MSFAQTFTNWQENLLGAIFAKARMTDIGKYVEELMAAGCMPKVAARVVAEVFSAGVRSGPYRDETAEKRRAYDRERKREKRKSKESGGIPVETNPLGTLWGEGPGLLRQLGVSEKVARQNIGLWLKRGHDPAKILEVVKQANDGGIGDPVPWITMGLGNERKRDTAGKVARQHPADLAFDLADEARRLERAAGLGR